MSLFMSKEEWKTWHHWCRVMGHVYAKKTAEKGLEKKMGATGGEKVE